jgi:5-methylcytosine-specific restriction endonuclease McrA
MQTLNKKTYDRSYSAERYVKFREEKTAISRDLFGGKCSLCGRTDGYEKFHFHHVLYHDEDSAYKRNSKALWTRLLRVKEAQAHPERFVLLCQSCHRLVTHLGNYFLRRANERKLDAAAIEHLLELTVREVWNRQDQQFED